MPRSPNARTRSPAIDGVVGQTVRDTLGLDYAVWEPIQYPHVEMLAAWEAFLPGYGAPRAISAVGGTASGMDGSARVERTVTV